MKIFFEKFHPLKLGLSCITISFAIANYAQSNVKEQFSSLTKIPSANASQYCINAPGHSCSWTGVDGLTHTVINAEMVED